jgi:homoserine acetyltransferase
MSKAARMHPTDGRMVEDKTGEIHDFRENANDRILVVIQQRRKHKERFVMMCGTTLYGLLVWTRTWGRPMAVLIYHG